MIDRNSVVSFVQRHPWSFREFYLEKFPKHAMGGWLKWLFIDLVNFFLTWSGEFLDVISNKLEDNLQTYFCVCAQSNITMSHVNVCIIVREEKVLFLLSIMMIRLHEWSGFCSWIMDQAGELDPDPLHCIERFFLPYSYCSSQNKQVNANVPILI